MMRTPANKFRNRAAAVRAFTLIEVSVSVVIVAVMFAAAMQTLGVSKAHQYTMAERARGQTLARGLLAEINALAYIDPDGTPLFGAEAGETRANYDDVDDYHNFTESPAKHKVGTVMNFSHSDTWRRTVTVVYVNPSTLATGSATDTGAKLITVTVHHGAKLTATVQAIRTSAP